MPNLTRYVHYVCGRVNFINSKQEDLDDLLNEFVKFADSYSKITKYYFIAHKGTNIPHIHFIFYSVAQVQVMTYYNKLRNWFIPKFTINDENVHVDKCESINAHLKYLLHQDKKSIELGKIKYEIEDLISNDELDTIECLIKSKKGVIDAYFLRDAVLDSANEFELMVRLTLPVYHRYSNEIRIIRENRAMLLLMREEEKKSTDYDDLPF